MFRKGLVFLFLMFLVISSFSLADEIVLQSGQRINIKIVDQTAEYIKINSTGKALYYFDELKSVNSSPVEYKPKEYPWYNLFDGEQYVADFKLNAGASRPVTIVTDKELLVGFRSNVDPKIFEEYVKESIKSPEKGPDKKLLELTSDINPEMSGATLSVYGFGGGITFKPKDGKIILMMINHSTQDYKIAVYKKLTGEMENKKTKISGFYLKGFFKDNPNLKIKVYEVNGLIKEGNPNNIEDKMTGTVIVPYDRSNHIWQEMNFKDGLTEGLSTEYNDDGYLKRLIPYNNGIENGIEKQYRHGYLEWEVPYKDGKVNGIKTAYSESGTKVLEIPLVDGVLQGERKEYYPNGKLKTVEAYENGHKFGLSRNYSEDGNIQYEGEFQDNKLNGLQKWYYTNGGTQFEGQYKDGKENGNFKWYNEDGTLKSAAIYKDGLRI